MSVRALRWAALALIALALAATWAAQRRGRPSVGGVVAEVPTVLGRGGEFELLNRDGAPVAATRLRGEPWVADFIFTRCALSCPRLTSLMIRLGEDAPGVRRVSFSVDPDHDTPGVLADYAAAYGIEDRDWLFLTGGREEIESLVVDGFKLPIVREPPPEPARPPDHAWEKEPILHSNRFVLVDAEGAIRGYYEATDEADYRELLADLAALRREEPPPGGEAE